MSLAEGTELEVKTAAYFQSQGYLVKRGINLTFSDEGSDITDIDVMAMSFSPTLAEERIIVDCKDKDRSKPYARILWLIGLREFAAGTRGIFVAPRIPWSAREFASKGNIEVLDSSNIDAHLDSVRFQDYGYGAASIALTEEIERRWKEVKKETREIKRAYNDMFSTLVEGHPITNINKILNFVGKVYSYKTSNSDVAWMKRHVCYEGLVLFTVMLARYASSSKWLLKDDRDKILDRKLTFGDIEPLVADRIIKIFGLEEEPTPSPEYTSALIEILEKNYSRKTVSVMSQYVDLYIFGHTILRSGGIAEDPIYKDNFLEIETISKEIISAFAYAAKLPIDYLVRR